MFIEITFINIFISENYVFLTHYYTMQKKKEEEEEKSSIYDLRIL